MYNDRMFQIYYLTTAFKFIGDTSDTSVLIAEATTLREGLHAA